MSVEVFDNHGKTFDRYTVVIEKNVFTMSSDPGSTEGMNQYCCPVEKMIAHCTKDQVSLEEVPKQVLLAIIERLCSC